MTAPLFSVLINNYNYASFVGEAIQSVKDQSLQDFELLVVDDGSTDNSIEVIENKISDMRKQGVLIATENGGQAAAFNAAADRARGKYLAFLDSDDLWDRNKLEQVAIYFDGSPKATIVQHKLRLLFADGKTGGLRPAPNFQGWAYGSYHETGGTGLFVPTSGICLRASPGLLVFPIDTKWRLMADMPMTRLCSLLGEILTSKEALGSYRVHDSNRCYGVSATDLTETRKKETREILNTFLTSHGEANRCIPEPPSSKEYGADIKPPSNQKHSSELHEALTEVGPLRYALDAAHLAIHSPRRAFQRVKEVLGIRKRKHPNLLNPLGVGTRKKEAEGLAARLIVKLASRELSINTHLSQSQRPEVIGGPIVISESENKRQYITWPPLRRQAELDDLLPRIRFHFRDGEDIRVLLSSSDIVASGKTPHYLHDYDQRCSIQYTLASEEQPLEKMARRYAGVLVVGNSLEPITKERIGEYPNVAHIDPRESEYETIQLHGLMKEGETRRLNNSRLKFLEWQDRQKKKNKAYILCTGPSLSRFSEFDFRDGYVISCNTAVSNRRLLTHAPPDIVAAADPVFHWGPSVYAHTFRRDLDRAASEIPFQLFSLNFYHHVIAHHLEMSEDRICEIAQKNHLVIDKFTNKWVAPQTGNILTLLLLPLAYTLADEIYIIGADGREPQETGFWAHDPDSQLTDMLQAAKQCHPAFFSKRDYDDYYDQHCAFLSEQISAIEASGGQVKSLTPSHIPCL